MAKICIISEELRVPFDKGFKKVCYEIVKVLKDKEVIFIGENPIDIQGCLCNSDEYEFY